MAHNANFTHAIPGASLTHKMGSLPHEKPPKYVDPHEALEYIWKQLNRPDILKQIWYLLEQGATVRNIAVAILYKAAMTGIIQMNLGIVISPVVSKMILSIGIAKGIKGIKVMPKFKDKTHDALMDDHINSHFKDRKGKVPPSALTAMNVPKQEEFDKSDAFMSKLMSNNNKQEQPQPIKHGSGLLNMAQGA